MKIVKQWLAALAIVCTALPASADAYQHTLSLFRQSPQVTGCFGDAYGYAVFPKIAKGGFGLGAARGSGRVYRDGQWVGNTTMTQLTLGFQIGGQSYRQIIFFENETAFDGFTSGNFEFGAQASAVAITASANAKVGTTGLGAGASPTSDRAGAQRARYNNGMAIFTHAKGGLMYEASLGGQKFSYTPR